MEIICFIYATLLTSCVGYLSAQKTTFIHYGKPDDYVSNQLEQLKVENKELELSLMNIKDALKVKDKEHKLILDSLRNTLDELKETSLNKAHSGSVYIRWGRTSCSSDSTQLYSGYLAGSHSHAIGGTSDWLCLPQFPQWSASSRTLDYNALKYKLDIFGGEYDVESQANPFSAYDLHNQDVPCAVCHTPGRVTQIMLPAQTSCPADWTLEYKGYLMTSPSMDGYTNPNTGTLCVDESPERLPGGRSDRIEAQLWLLVPKCGVLRCPPYDEKVLSCVVCTR